MILDLLNPFTVTPEMREFREQVKKLLGRRFSSESRDFRRFIQNEHSSPIDSACSISIRLLRKGYHTGAALAIAACVDLIEAEEKETFAKTIIHPAAVSDRWEGIRGFMKSRGLRFINLQHGGAI